MSAIALRVVSDAAPSYAHSEPQNWARVTLDVLARRDVSASELRTLLGIVWLSGPDRKTDEITLEIARVSGQTFSVTQRNIGTLAAKGWIERSGGGRYRRLAHFLNFKTTPDRPANHAEIGTVGPDPTTPKSATNHAEIGHPS